jgi:hypothetical protein
LAHAHQYGNFDTYEYGNADPDHHTNQHTNGHEHSNGDGYKHANENACAASNEYGRTRSNIESFDACRFQWSFDLVALGRFDNLVIRRFYLESGAKGALS